MDWNEEERLFKMSEAYIQIILSLIIILITFLISKGTFKKGNNLDLNKELKKWKEEDNGTGETFLEFKKYEYNQTFWFVAFLTGFSFFSFSIVLNFMEVVVNLVGWIPYLVLFCCNFYFIWRFCLKIVPKAHEKSIRDVRYLLLEKDKK